MTVAQTKKIKKYFVTEIILTRGNRHRFLPRRPAFECTCTDCAVRIKVLRPMCNCTCDVTKIAASKYQDGRNGLVVNTGALISNPIAFSLHLMIINNCGHVRILFLLEVAVLLTRRPVWNWCVVLLVFWCGDRWCMLRLCCC